MPLLLLAAAIAAILIYHVARGGPGLRIFARDETYIAIDDGALYLRKGFVPRHAMTVLADLLRDAGISQGYIAVSPDRRVAVSWHVPPALHQKIRNVLLSDA